LPLVTETQKVIELNTTMNGNFVLKPVPTESFCQTERIQSQIDPKDSNPLDHSKLLYPDYTTPTILKTSTHKHLKLNTDHLKPPKMLNNYVAEADSEEIFSKL